MKICLINPPFIYPSKEIERRSRALGIRSLSSFLRQNGNHEVTIVDGLVLGFSQIRPYSTGFMRGLEPKEIIQYIPLDTELIGISVPFSQLAPVAHEIAERCKSIYPDIPVIMGGMYPSTQPEIALTSRADYILVGEGELPMLDLSNGMDPENIQGIYSMASDEDKKSFIPSRCVEQLDSLPFPDYSIPLIEHYLNIPDPATTSLLTSRGCPFSCNFCSVHPVFGKKYRYRSAKNVLAEIQMAVDSFKIHTFEFEDDNFSLLKDRTVKILEGIIRLNEKGSGIRWKTPNGLRIDTLDDDVIQLMKQANCYAISLALEHGDREMLDIMNKKLDLDQAYQVIESAIHWGIPKINLFVIVGYPGETRERFDNSVRYLEKIRRFGGYVKINVFIAQPYPGTKLLKTCRENGYLTDINIDNFLLTKKQMGTANTISIITPDFDDEEIYRRRKILEDLFRAQPQSIRRIPFQIYNRLKGIFPQGR